MKQNNQKNLRKAVGSHAKIIDDVLLNITKWILPLVGSCVGSSVGSFVGSGVGSCVGSGVWIGGSKRKK